MVGHDNLTCQTMRFSTLAAGAKKGTVGKHAFQPAQAPADYILFLVV